MTGKGNYFAIRCPLLPKNGKIFGVDQCLMGSKDRSLTKAIMTL